MKIGFDISQTGHAKAGCGYFADSLIRHLASIDTANDYLLYRTFGDSFWPLNPDETCQIEGSNFSNGLQHPTFDAAQQFWRNPPEDAAQQLGFPSIIHSNNFFCPSRIAGTRLIYTLYDLSFLDYPEWTTEANRITCFSGVFNASLHADFIMAISEFSRQHFLATFPHYPAERIKVIYPACRFYDTDAIPRPAGLSALVPDQFWLTVGTLEPRKNHKRLLEAYARLKATQGQALPLVLAGGKGWVIDDLQRTLEHLHLRDDVIMLGYVDDNDLHWLYQNCFALVYPSLFEGFGLPVLEAMALGAAVITSQSSSIPEIVGAAGILLDPYQEDEIFAAMLSLTKDEPRRAELKKMATRRAQAFSWKAAAAAVLETYQYLAAKPSGKDIE